MYLNLFEIEDEQRKGVAQLIASIQSSSFAKFFEQILQQDIKQSLNSETYFQFEEMVLLLFKVFFKDNYITTGIKC